MEKSWSDLFPGRVWGFLIMNIKQNKNQIVIEIPMWSKRNNPYDDDGDYGLYNTLTGLIVKNKNGLDEIGLAYTIDMDYKGKDDQVGGFAVMLNSEMELVDICEKLKLDIHYIDLR